MTAPTETMGLVAQAVQQGLVDLVKTNEVKFMQFTKPTKGRVATLGVQGLGACSVIVLASDYAAILAHVGPNEPGARADDTKSFVRLANNKVNEIEELYRRNEQYFGNDSHAYSLDVSMDNFPLSYCPQ